MRRFVPDREMLRSPLARRLIVAIIVVSSTITLCLTAFQIYGEYRSELGSIQDDFRQIEEVHLNSLVQSLWATNEADLQLQIEGMAHVPNIEHIVVREGDRIWAQAGQRASRRTIERQYPLTFAHRGQTLEIGVLTVVAGLDSVYRRLINEAFIILASNALKTFLVAGFAFAFFHWLVNRHLVAIAAYVRSLDLRGRTPALTLGRAARRQPDELDEVAAAVNRMHENALAWLSERSRATEAQAKLAAIVEHSSDAIVGRALDYTITSWNAAAERMFGYTAAEVIGRDPIEMFPLELQPKIAERRRLLSAGQMVPDYETVRIAKDGRHIDVEISYAAIKDHSGCVVGTSVILRDITPRIAAEKALRKNYELLDRIFATTHFCVVYLDRDFNFIRVNKAYADACGHPAEFFAGKNHFELYPGEKAEAIFRRVAATGEPFTIYANPFEFPDHPEWGVTYWDWTLHPLRGERGDVEGLLFALLDVTERKRAEQQLERKTAFAQLMESLARAANEAVTPEEAMRICLTRLCGFGNWVIGRVAMTHELSGDFEHSGSSIWHAADLACHEEFIRISQDVRNFPVTGRFAGVAVREKRPVWISDVNEMHEFRRREAMLADRLHAAFAFPVVVQGKVAAFLEFFADTPRPEEPGLIAASETIAAQLARLIERSRAEKLNVRLAAIVESSNDAILTRGPDRTILSWNAAAERLFGWTAQEAVGQSIDLIMLPERIGTLRGVIERVGRGEHVSPVEAIHRRKDGSRFPTEITFSPIRDGQGNVIAHSLTVRDMSELKRSENALRRIAARLRELSRRLREVEESERRAISHELHDRIGQGLTTLSLMVGTLDAQFPAESRSAVQTQLQDMQTLLRSVVVNVRDVMAELRPPALDDYGLLAALRHLVTEFAKRTGIAVNLSGVDPYPRLPPIVETAMFRISQEALNNIVKHAHAKKVEINLNAASDQVVLDIADDGAGFDTRNIADGGEHWGMITMRERAEAVGITFRLESAPGAGTRIVLEAERASS